MGYDGKGQYRIESENNIDNLEIDFKNTAHYDDELTIITKLIAKPTAKIKFSYEVLNNAGDIIAIAKTDLVFLDKATKKPIRCPDFILDHL